MGTNEATVNIWEYMTSKRKEDKQKVLLLSIIMCAVAFIVVPILIVFPIAAAYKLDTTGMFIVWIASLIVLNLAGKNIKIKS